MSVIEVLQPFVYILHCLKHARYGKMLEDGTTGSVPTVGKDQDINMQFEPQLVNKMP